MLGLKKLVNDRNPWVRKTVAGGLAKVYEWVHGMAALMTEWTRARSQSSSHCSRLYSPRLPRSPSVQRSPRSARYAPTAWTSCTRTTGISVGYWATQTSGDRSSRWRC